MLKPDGLGKNKMLNKILLAVSLGFFACASGAAQQTPVYDIRLNGLPVYSDPGFQEFIETSYGYLGGRNKIRAERDLRDSVSSRVPALKTNIASVPAAQFLQSAPASHVRPSAANYVFVSIQPKVINYSGLLQDISASAGFVLYGERTVYLKSERTTLIVGWARAERLEHIFNNPGVAKVYLSQEKPVKA